MNVLLSDRDPTAPRVRWGDLERAHQWEKPSILRLGWVQKEDRVLSPGAALAVTQASLERPQAVNCQHRRPDLSYLRKFGYWA